MLIKREELENHLPQVAAELLAYIMSKQQKEEGIPLSVFSNTKLTVFEAIIKFLREEKRLTYHEIGQLLQRETTTISTTYFRAAKKLQERLQVDYTKVIPFSEFKKNQTFAPLEIVVFYLHNTNSLAFRDIAKILNRDSRTIWTVYHRAKKKVEKE